MNATVKDHGALLGSASEQPEAVVESFVDLL